MQPTIMDILARQDDLAKIASRCTDDVIEARYLVHTVLARAFKKYASPRPDVVLSDALRRDLRALVARAKQANARLS